MLLSALGLVLVAILSGCSSSPASTAPVVRIGLVAPFEGRHRAIGYDVIYAARMAIREWNADGGVEGLRVELVALDDGGDPELALRSAQSLALDPAILGVVGHWLDQTTAAAQPAYTQAGLPMVSMFRTDQSPGPTLAEFSSRYRSVAPFGEEPGPYAVPAYGAINRLIEAIGQSARADGEPTRDGVGAALAGSP